MRRSITFALVIVLGLLTPALGQTVITAAGSTFVYPFLSKAFAEYAKAHGGVSISYQPVGSGQGVQLFSARSVDFGASDLPMYEEQLDRLGFPVIQVPVALGGEAIVYNVPGAPANLRLSRHALTDIFLGRIASWNDPEIAEANAGSKLPDLPVVVIHRADLSGTTYIFTSYLSAISPDWKSRIGAAEDVQWPSPGNVAALHNEGVAKRVHDTPGAIGYVELAYAVSGHLPSAALENRAGHYLRCTPQTVQAAAATKTEISPTDFLIVDRDGGASYPIAGYSWAILYKNLLDPDRARVVHDVLSWILSNNGQQLAASLNYVALPAAVQREALHAIDEMRT
jgi:phosphate transport system substrate-binding protein